MTNKVQLYIEGLQADLDNNSFLLLNYTMEDLSNPTIVKNSFSRQITLKGTPRNDEIFGHIYRNDRDTLYGSPYTGPQFDPTRKTSFVIYNEMMEVLESGYLKLDEITINRKSRNYKVTLYGGLVPLRPLLRCQREQADPRGHGLRRDPGLHHQPHHGL